MENCVQYELIETHKADGKIKIAGPKFSFEETAVEERFEMGILSNCPLIKFHFSLEGAYCYESKKAEQSSVHIPENYCNMFFSPHLDGKEIIANEKIKIFEIYVVHDYLQSLLHPTYQESFEKLHSAISELKPFRLWENSKPIPPSFISKINEIISCAYTGQLRQRYLEGKLTALLIDFLMEEQTSELQTNEVKVPEADYLTLVRLESYIKKNLKKSHTILDLAERAGFNPTKLKRDFKKVYGKTVYKYITHLRMEEAEKKIVQNGITVAQAAYEAGYANPQHFTVAFKKTMGYLPSVLNKPFIYKSFKNEL